MAVFRVERTGDYTVMSNFHLKDKRLSLKAKGLLSQMLSLPDDWDYTLSGLCFINRESKDAIRSAINELERAGYIRRRQTIVENPKPHGKSYNKWLGDQAKPSHRELLRVAIDNALEQMSSAATLTKALPEPRSISGMPLCR